MRTAIVMCLVALAALPGCGGEQPKPAAPPAPAQSPGVEGMQWLKKNGFIKNEREHIPAKDAKRP